MAPEARAAVFALRLLGHEKPRLAFSVAGVSFAVVLMLVQMGFRNSLLDSAVHLLDMLDADVVVAHKDKRYLLDNWRIPRQRLYQALAAPGVAAAWPLTWDVRFWKEPGGIQRPIRVFSVDPAAPMWVPEDLRDAVRGLAWPDNALIDGRARRDFGPLGPGPAQVERRRLNVSATFRMGADLDADGNLVVSEDTFARIAPRPFNLVEMVLIKAAPGADLRALVASLRAALPGDVLVHTKDQLREREIRYWTSGTPVSIVVGIGMMMGFLVGTAICYQVLYTEIADHLPEFATLKAMGYHDRFLAIVVLLEALSISLTASLPGVLLGWAVYSLLGAVTGLLLRLTAARIGLVLGLTVLMCAVAGLLALHRALRADPAELFR